MPNLNAQRTAPWRRQFNKKAKVGSQSLSEENQLWNNLFEDPRPSANPFEEPSPSMNPFEEPTQSTNPFEVSTQSTNPFEVSTQSANPFEVSIQGTNPFEEPTQSANPFEEPSSKLNPFGEPGDDTEYLKMPKTTWPLSPNQERPYTNSKMIAKHAGITERLSPTTIQVKEAITSGGKNDKLKRSTNRIRNDKKEKIDKILRESGNSEATEENDITKRKTRTTLSYRYSGISPSEVTRITKEDVVGMIDKLMRDTSARSPGTETVPNEYEPYVAIAEMSEAPSTFNLTSVSHSKRPAKESEEMNWDRYQYLVGPLRTWDTPRQTSQATTTDPSKSIQIRYQTFHTDTGEVETKLPASELPVTVPTQIQNVAANFPNRIVLQSQDGDGYWHGMSYKDMTDDIERLAMGLIQFGLTPETSIIIAGNTNKKMVLAFYSCLFTGFPAIPIDSITSYHFKLIKFLVMKAKVEAIVCETHNDCVFLVKNLRDLSSLKIIVDLQSDAVSTKQVAMKTTLHSYHTWIWGGNVTKQTYLSFKTAHLAPNKIAFIKPQYFSITGNSPNRPSFKNIGDEYNPRCIMKTHDNVVYNARRVAGALNLKPKNERWLSHLTWSQAFEFEILLAPLLGATLYLSGAHNNGCQQLLTQCREIKPTMFLVTNCLLKQLVEHLQEDTSWGGAEWLKTWAQKQGKTTGLCLEMGTYSNTSVANRIKFHLAEFLFFRKARERLGLDAAYDRKAPVLSATYKHTRLFRLAHGHEDLDDATKGFLRSINLPFLTWLWFDEAGTVALHNNRVTQGNQSNQAKLLDDVKCWTESKNGRLEDQSLCFAGRSLFAGYLANESATKERFSPNAYSVTSSCEGACYKRLVLVGKRLENFILSYSGKCILAAPIVKKILTHIPNGVIQDCEIIGEGMDRLLLVLSFTTTEEGVLSSAGLQWCRGLKSTSTQVTDLLDYKDQAVRSELLSIIAKVNQQMHSRTQLISGMVILPRTLQEDIEIDKRTNNIRRDFLVRVFNSTIKKAYEKRWKVLQINSSDEPKAMPD